MSTHKYIDRICCAVLALVLAMTVLYVNAENLGVQKTESVTGYEARLFDTSRVHTIDIVMDDWDGFLETCTKEEYADCNLVIDGEAYRNVAIRAKGNTSLSQVASYGNNRYSFKVEFDHYDSNRTYYGLDKLCLNNIIQDNTYMKDYLTYQLMGEFGVASPLCSYVNITVNGENWGLYLAVEGVEESFLQRNYGNDYGNLYKPDSMDMGGGRGNGKSFFMENGNGEGDTQKENGNGRPQKGERPEGVTWPDMEEGGMPGEMTRPDMNGNGTQEGTMRPDMEGGEMPGGMAPPDMEGNGMPGGMTPPDVEGNGMPGGKGGMGSNDVSLIYTDDNYSSYSNIFENAKTDIKNSDKDRLIASLKNINENSELEDSVEIEQVIRYFVVHNFVLNFDSYTGSMIHNYYLYEEDGKLSMIPWDYNLAFGGFQSQTDAESLVNYPIDTPVSGGTTDSRPMLAWIFQNETYTEMYHTRFAEFVADYFDSGRFAQMMDDVKTMIAPYVEKDPTKFCTYEEFETGIDTLKEFCLLRAKSIQGQLEGTIGSTTETQTDKNGFIDAGNIQISDMGSMGDFGGKGGGGQRR
mgnify:CR=1 FL=1